MKSYNKRCIEHIYTNTQQTNDLLSHLYSYLHDVTM